MPDGRENLKVEVVERLADVERTQWDACAGSENPFLSYDFLSSLEDSGSVTADAGWAPRHVLIQDDAGEILACAPVYLKGHSHGEYVFDWGWAEAYERAGGSYYPKLVCAVPFTPVTGPRLMVREGVPDALGAQLKRQLASTLAGLVSGANLSSVHANFLGEDDVKALHEAGFLPRSGLQYHWNNNNYQDFDEFLGELNSRKRKAIKRERKGVAQADLTIERLTGAAITGAHWDAMYAFYQDTGARKWGRPYLNREFFRLLGERMADQVMLIIAKRGEKIIAGALNLIGEDALYGRYWGCAEDVPFLHFELCYHQAVEAAIERGLARVEAGAQGEHKIARGYLPTLTHSAHFIADEGFRDAVANFLDHERRAIEHEFAVLMEESPFRKEPSSG
ncbi:GNAT family N-acetyltransferase [Pseudomonadota bacterium]